MNFEILKLVSEQNTPVLNMNATKSPQKNNETKKQN